MNPALSLTAAAAAKMNPRASQPGWSWKRDLRFRRFEFLDHFAQFVQGDILDLAHALTGDAEFLADLLQGFFRAAIETETVTQDGRFARIERLDHFLQHAGDGLVFELFVRRLGVLVGDDFGESVRFIVADGRVQRRRADRGGAHLRHARGGHAQFFGQFLVGRLASEFLLQLHCDPAHLGDFVHEMNGQPDGFGLVGQSALDRLFDPPGTVGGKLAALGGIEAFDGLHQADVALADQIEQGQAKAFIIVSDLDHQPQIGLDHLLARLFVALLDAGGQLDLLLGGEQLDLADFAQVKLDRRVAIVSGAFAFQGCRDGLGGGRDCRRLRLRNSGCVTGGSDFGGLAGVPTGSAGGAYALVLWFEARSPRFFPLFAWHTEAEKLVVHPVQPQVNLRGRRFVGRRRPAKGASGYRFLEAATRASGVSEKSVTKETRTKAHSHVFCFWVSVTS